MVVRHGQPATPIEVVVEDSSHSWMQGDEAALSELGPPDQQHPVGLYIGEPKVERL